MLFVSSVDFFFSKLTFSKHISVPVSNSLESDWIQVRTATADNIFVGNRQKVKAVHFIVAHILLPLFTLQNVNLRDFSHLL